VCSQLVVHGLLLLVLFVMINGALLSWLLQRQANMYEPAVACSVHRIMLLYGSATGTHLLDQQTVVK
jgi:hypothetical protein